MNGLRESVVAFSEEVNDITRCGSAESLLIFQGPGRPLQVANTVVQQSRKRPQVDFKQGSVCCLWSSCIQAAFTTALIRIIFVAVQPRRH